MKKSIKRLIVSFLAIMAASVIISCGGGSVDNTPAVVNATKAFQIYGTNEFSDTLAGAIEIIKYKSISKDVAPWKIKLTKDVTDNGATVSGISKGVVIDFQNYTYTLSSGSSGIIIDNGASEVEISGGTIQVPEGSTLSKTAVITSNSDLKLSGTTLNVNASANAIESTAGTVSIGAKTTITTKDEKDAIVASNESEVKVTDSEVTITGGLKLSEKAEVDLGQAIYIPTKPIEKDPESKFKAVKENIQPKEGSEVEESNIEEVLHNHTFSEEWVHDENNHWHVATCEHTSLQGSFSLHSWSDWIVVTVETHTTSGTRTRTCSGCGREESEVIPASTEAHTFSDEWSWNETNHWHAATCGHDTVKGNDSAHAFVVETENITEGIIRTITYEICSVCGYLNPDSLSLTLSGPEYDLDEGVYGEGNVVRLSTPYEEVKIYYTIDGSNPTPSSILYVNPIVLDRNMTIKAFAYVVVEEMTFCSDIVSKSYLVKVANPQFGLKDKSTVGDSSSLVLSSSTEGAQIIYTTDGSIPSSTNGNTYNTPINFISSCTVRAVAIKDGMESSDVISADYYHINDSSPDSICLNPKLVINESFDRLGGDCYSVDFPEHEEDDVLIQMYDLGPNTITIYYTIDGSDPATSSTVKKYTEPFGLFEKTAGKEYVVIKMLAINENNEPVGSSTYKIWKKGPAEGFLVYDKGYYSDGWRYIEYYPYSIGSFIFGCSKDSSGISEKFSTRDEVGTGLSNTQEIISRIGEYAYRSDEFYNNEITSEYAAKVCDELVLNGFDDWVLPSAGDVYLYKRIHVDLFDAWPSSASSSLTSTRSSYYVCFFDRGGYYSMGYWITYNENCVSPGEAKSVCPARYF